MEFDHTPHASTGIKVISASEELIETLEDNQVMALFVCCVHMYFEHDSKKTHCDCDTIEHQDVL